MQYSQIHRLMELYMARSCAFDDKEKALLSDAFPKMQPKTQMRIIRSLQKEHE